VKTLLAILLSIGLLAAVGAAQPTITQVSNAASFILPPTPGSDIAQGSFAAIFGTGLGPSTAAVWNPYPLPTSLGGTSVKIGGKDAYIFFTIAGQVNIVVPSDTPTGKQDVTVTFSGATSAAFSVNVVASEFGIFARNSAGSGPGSVTDANYALLTPVHTAKPGDTVILWGTGLGPVADASTEATGPPTQTDMKDAQSVKVWVGNQAASVAYAGRAGYNAEDQINFVVPQGVQGCYVTVAVQTGSGQVASNFTSMPVDPQGNPCKDADGIDMSDIATKVENGQSVNVGVISLLSNYVPLVLVPGTAPLQFDNDTVNGEIGTFSPGTLSAFQGFTLAPSVGSCSVSQFLKFPPPVDPALGDVHFLDAGASLSLQGPLGTATVNKNATGAGYGALVGGAAIQDLIQGNGIKPFFLNSTANADGSFTPTGIASGTYTLTGPGGADVGAMSGSLDVTSAAASFKWTNPPSGTIPRNQPLTITWTGGDPSGFVNITAVASTVTGLLPADTTPGMFMECMAPASAGTFTVPAWVLQALPATASVSTAPVAGELLVGPSSGGVSFTTTPTGLDAAYIFYHFIWGQQASFQ
jgi:uncharacterized protein (TIGR03437 family)